MGLLFMRTLDKAGYRCRQCRVQIIEDDAIICRSFRGASGPAYLVDSCINLVFGASTPRFLKTGEHHVSDAYCCCCLTPLGWRYDVAVEKTQRYKEGRVMLEEKYLIHTASLQQAATGAYLQHHYHIQLPAYEQNHPQGHEYPPSDDNNHNYNYYNSDYDYSGDQRQQQPEAPSSYSHSLPDSF